MSEKNLSPALSRRALVAVTGLSLVAALAASLLAPSAVPALATGSSNGSEEQISDGILVSLRVPGSDEASLLSDASSALEDADLEVTDVVCQEEGTVLVEAHPTEGQTDEEALEEARALDGVESAQLNYVYHLIEPVTSGSPLEVDPTLMALDSVDKSQASGILANDPIAQVSDPSTSPNQYWLYNTNLVSAWEQSRAEGSVTIVTIDSGAMLTHEDLASNVLADLAWDTYYDRPLSQTLAETGTSDNGGHGTHVAGIAAGVANNGTGIAGASYNAKILPVKVVNDESDKGMNTSSIRGAFEYVFDLIDNGTLTDVHVFNLSLGAYDKGDEKGSVLNDEKLHSAIRTARNEYDIAVVCAGGNGDGISTPYTYPLYPSDFEECISVTALNADGTNVVWSDYNDAKDISAPGSSIYSTTLSSTKTDTYGAMSGTSMSTPMVSGTIALMFALAPTATVDDVCEALYATATPVDDPENDRSQTSGSHGALDAAAALAYFAEHWTPSFDDVPEGVWYYDCVTFVAKQGIMTGYEGTNLFGAADSLQRQDAAKLLYNYLGNGEKAPECGLVDVEKGSYYADAVNWCVAHGIFEGYKDGSNEFGVGDPLTREQLVKVIYSYAAKEGDVVDESLFYALPDHESASEWAVEAAKWALSKGVIGGAELEDGTRVLLPQGTASRAEMAKIMMNAIEAGLL